MKDRAKSPRSIMEPPGRLSSYATLTAVVSVLFLTGLAVPYLFGDPVPTAAPTSVEAGAPSTTAATAAGGDDGSSGVDPVGPDSSSSVDDTSDGGTSAGPDADPAGGERSPARGGAGDAPVAAASGEPVRVGFALVDLGAAREAGFVLSFASPEMQQQWWQAAVDEVNDNGGLNGRPIEPVYRRVNVLDSSDAQQTCVRFTEDDKVFAVVGVLYFAVADECVVNGHQTPLVTIGPNDDATYASGLLVTLMPKTSRVISSFAGELDRQKLLTGRNVGILGDAGSDPRGRAMEQMEARVRGAGAEVRTATLGTDLASAAAQTGVVVNNWRNAGVDTVIFIVNPTYAINFVQNADRQFWTPDYFASDFANLGNSDIATSGMSEGFDGALSITSTTVNRPPNAAMARCLEVLEKQGRPVEDPEHHGAAGQQCDMLNAFVAGARAAGPTLTKGTFSQGIQAVREVPATRIGGGSFGPGKFDLADLVSNVRWDYDCGCWQPQGEFRRAAT